jgi:predicted PurR-regulated permease PerM
MLAAAIAGFFWVAGASLVDQAKMLQSRFNQVEQQVLQHAPRPLLSVLAPEQGGARRTSTIAPYIIRAGRLAISGIVIGVLALILMIYLLIEGRRTYQWLLAFVPARHRPRVDQTACDAEEAIKGYVLGNIATSVFATLFVLTLLTVLHVPGALLLALLAGIFDFVPVVGFICSAVPAILLALTVSGTTALLVLVLYAVYHGIENYIIAPRVYGGRLRMSNLAVIVAFAVGAELGGIMGALLALPAAAMYPAVERIWLKDYLGRDTV